MLFPVDTDEKSKSACCWKWIAFFGVLVVLAVGIPIAVTYLSGDSEEKDCFSMLYTFANKGGQSSPTYSAAVPLDSTADLSGFSFHGDTWVCQQDPSDEHLNGLTPPEKRLCATLESKEMYNLRDMDSCDGVSRPMPDTIPLCFVEDELGLSEQFSATAPWGDELVDVANATWGAAIDRTFVNHPYQDTGNCVEVRVQDLLNSPDGTCDTTETDGTQATKQTACVAHNDKTSCDADTSNKCAYIDDEDVLGHVSKNKSTFFHPERYGNAQITMCHDDRCKKHTKELFVHEIGHLLGLEHTTKTGSVMNDSLNAKKPTVKPVDKLLNWHDRVRGTALYARKRVR